MQRRKICKMFYKQFSKITDIDESIVKAFDSWLVSLPRHLQKNITASGASARSGIDYYIITKLLSFAHNENILAKHYLIKCPICSSILQQVDKEYILTTLDDIFQCDECGYSGVISTDDVITAYELIKHPVISEKDLSNIITNDIKPEESNFPRADSLSNSISDLYDLFYNPDESAYEEFSTLRNKLDMDYGNNTTQKGNLLEELALKLFSSIKYVSGTNSIKTLTNQFDCTLNVGIKPCIPSVFDYLSPYFIVECKNEKKKPDNTYINKLESIMNTNEAKLGIILARNNATTPCFTIAREHYLTTRNSNHPQIIITLSDEDLSKIIDQRINILQYLHFKILQVTTNSKSSKYEDFIMNSQ